MVLFLSLAPFFVSEPHLRENLTRMVSAREAG